MRLAAPTPSRTRLGSAFYISEMPTADHAAHRIKGLAHGAVSYCYAERPLATAEFILHDRSDALGTSTY
jgi:hypothetical protein